MRPAFILLLAASLPWLREALDLRRAVVVRAGGGGRAAEVLVQEVERRARILLPAAEDLPANTPACRGGNSRGVQVAEVWLMRVED